LTQNGFVPSECAMAKFSPTILVTCLSNNWGTVEMGGDATADGDSYFDDVL